MRERRTTVAWIVAGALLAAGMVVVVVGLLTPVAFGWFAYQPLAGAVFAPGSSGVFVARTTIVGWVLVALGLIGVAYLLGRRAGSPRRAESGEADESD